MQINDVVIAMFHDGHGPDSIALRLGCKPALVRKVLQAHGLRRDRQEALAAKARVKPLIVPHRSIAEVKRALEFHDSMHGAAVSLGMTTAELRKLKSTYGLA